MRKSRWHFLKNKWFISMVVVVVIITVIVWVKNSNKAPKFDSVPVSFGDITETVSVTGTISPVDKADLAFQKSGVIKFVYVKVGDSVYKGQTIATLDGASDKAAVDSAKATLDDVARTLTPQELAIQKTALDNALRDAVNASHDGFVKVQGAIFNYVDIFFTNPQSVNPVINIKTQSTNHQTAINNERLMITETLNNWSTELSTKIVVDPTILITKSRSHLSDIKVFMDKLSTIVNDLSPSNSGISQSTISAHILAINTGLSVLNSAIDIVTAAQSILSAAQSNYDFKLSGNSSQSIAAQAAKVSQAEALLMQGILISPIDGVVTRADPSAGEFAAAGQSDFTVQNSDFKIESYVPEADIAKIVVGNISSSTLDAYGSYVDFPAEVTMINPAETIIEGVPTYKVTLRFIETDPRIRSGMTANLEILTHKAVGVLNIPYRAITIGATSTTVRIVATDGKNYSSVPVIVGLKGSRGTIEVISGLKLGDKVVTYVK